MNAGLLAAAALTVLAACLVCAAAPPPKAAAKAPPARPDWAGKDIKAGMVGLDTSHAVAFANVFRRHPQWRVKIVAALPETSKDMPKSSVARCPKFTETLRKQGVRIVASMDELLKLVDAVLVESVDGRPHLRQARPALKAGKPVFIDKPFTAGLADAREILKLSKQTGVPFFSSSCVRFQPEIAKFRTDPGVGRLTKAQGSSPMHIEPHHPDLFWYGIHGVEALYTVMGRGCLSVKRQAGKDVDVTTGKWTGGRVGVFRGVRKGSYKPLVKVWGTEGRAESKGGYNYNALCEAIAKFFQTGKAPIDPLETLEIVEFMTAAQLSKERGGAEVTLEEVRKLTPAGSPKRPAGVAGGEAILREYITQEALKLDGAFLAGVKGPADWRRRRAEYRRGLLDMFGLQPLPKRTDLKAVITGTLEREDFVVENLHFQSRPHLYVTGNLYRPKKAEGRLPAVLYVCGHAGRGRDGNKTAYQHHAIWFASHGYVCLVIDSLQLGEIAAIHHGTYRYDRWWWHSRGYTPAGVECWNCIRALDYLQSRQEVDATRIAVTGRSGGGAYSFWLAAADERVKAAVPVSGLSDLEEYLKPPVINGHCDCMFLYNTHQWPWTRIAALVAPRGLLFANSDRDRIFPMPGNRRVIARLRKLYRLLGHADRVDAFVTPGGHKDTPPLRNAAFTWINRFLKDDARPVVEPKTYPKIPAADLRAFPDQLPADEINTKIDRTFVPRANVKPPGSARALQGLRKTLLAALRKTTFSAFPAAYPGKRVKLADKAAAGTCATEPPIVTGYRYVPGKKAGRTCWLVVLGRGEDDADVPDWAARIIGEDTCVLLSPRGVGPTERTIKKPFYFRRAMALLGRTMDSGRVWDVMAFVHAADRPGTTWKVLGRGPAGVIGAYAALFEKKIEGVLCIQPPASHDNGPYLLGVMRTLDIPDALGLLAPRPLRVVGTKAKAFDKTAAYYKATGAERQFTR